jgi:flagellum-specific peptidoglycan hydrolase FlgJ
MNMAESQFITEVGESARITHMGSGIPASITIAQAILESGWGKTRLAREDFNYFGIKAVEGQDYVEFLTHEYINGIEQVVKADFARYKSPLDCFRAHASLLANGPRYALAMRCKNSPIDFARALQTCGYSTNRPPLAKKPPYYSDVLITLVDEFNLRNYDVQSDPAGPAKVA